MSSDPLDNQRGAPSGRARTGTSAFVWVSLLALLSVLVGLSGCDSPQTLFKTQPPGLAGQTGTSKDSKTDKASTKKKPIDVEVRSLEPGADKAKRLLAQNYANFLKRRDLGFDTNLPGKVLDDLHQLGQRTAGLPGRVGQMGGRQLVEQFFPALAVLLLLIAFALLDRAFLGWAKRWQARVHIDLSRVATRLLRALILVSGRIAPVALLVLLSYFPVQALAHSAPWSQFLTHALWLGVAYRAISAAFIVVFSGGLLPHVPREDAQRLQTYSIWVTRIIFGFLLALAAIAEFNYRKDVYQFGQFCLQLAVAFVPLYLFLARSSVLALLPDYSGSQLYSFFRRTIERYYYWLVFVTMLLLLMRAAGYDRAATFILVRGYAIILLVILSFVLANALTTFLRRRTEAIDVDKQRERDLEGGQPQLAKSLEQFLFVGGGILLVVFILDLLAVRAPVVALLRSPLLSFGHVQVSLFNVLAVGLIVFGTILVVKILKAILNAKVYPAFSVDVGVAYAINTLLSYVLFVVGFLMVLGAIGVNLSAIAVVLASLGVGIGFGLQTLTENLISGFIILFGRSVKKGDFITVRDTYGRVEAVGARSVIIRTPDNYDMLIPSKEIVGGQITNWTFRDATVRLHVPVGVGYSAKPPEVKEVLLQTAKDFQHVLDTPAPEVWLVGFGDSSVNFELLVYFDCREISPNRFKGLLYFEIWEALHAADIEIPFPQRDLHVRSAPGLSNFDKLLRGERDGASGQRADEVETEE